MDREGRAALDRVLDAFLDPGNALPLSGRLVPRLQVWRGSRSSNSANSAEAARDELRKAFFAAARRRLAHHDTTGNPARDENGRPLALQDLLTHLGDVPIAIRYPARDGDDRRGTASVELGHPVSERPEPVKTHVEAPDDGSLILDLPVGPRNGPDTGGTLPPEVTAAGRAALDRLLDDFLAPGHRLALTDRPRLRLHVAGQNAAGKGRASSDARIAVLRRELTAAARRRLTHHHDTGTFVLDQDGRRLGLETLLAHLDDVPITIKDPRNLGRARTGQGWVRLEPPATRQAPTVGETNEPVETHEPVEVSETRPYTPGEGPLIVYLPDRDGRVQSRPGRPLVPMVLPDGQVALERILDAFLDPGVARSLAERPTLRLRVWRTSGSPSSVSLAEARRDVLHRELLAAAERRLAHHDGTDTPALDENGNPLSPQSLLAHLDDVPVTINFPSRTGGGESGQAWVELEAPTTRSGARTGSRTTGRTRRPARTGEEPTAPGTREALATGGARPYTVGDEPLDLDLTRHELPSSSDEPWAPTVVRAVRDELAPLIDGFLIPGLAVQLAARPQPHLTVWRNGDAAGSTRNRDRAQAHVALLRAALLDAGRRRLAHLSATGTPVLDENDQPLTPETLRDHLTHEVNVLHRAAGNQRNNQRNTLGGHARAELRHPTTTELTALGRIDPYTPGDPPLTLELHDAHGRRRVGPGQRLIPVVTAGGHRELGRLLDAFLAPGHPQRLSDRPRIRLHVWGNAGPISEARSATLREALLAAGRRRLEHHNSSPRPVLDEDGRPLPLNALHAHLDGTPIVVGQPTASSGGTIGEAWISLDRAAADTVRAGTVPAGTPGPRSLRHSSPESARPTRTGPVATSTGGHEHPYTPGEGPLDLRLPDREGRTYRRPGETPLDPVVTPEGHVELRRLLDAFLLPGQPLRLSDRPRWRLFVWKANSAATSAVLAESRAAALRRALLEVGRQRLADHARAGTPALDENGHSLSPRDLRAHLDSTPITVQRPPKRVETSLSGNAWAELLPSITSHPVTAPSDPEAPLYTPGDAPLVLDLPDRGGRDRARHGQAPLDPVVTRDGHDVLDRLIDGVLIPHRPLHMSERPRPRLRVWSSGASGDTSPQARVDVLRLALIAAGERRLAHHSGSVLDENGHRLTPEALRAHLEQVPITLHRTPQANRPSSGDTTDARPGKAWAFLESDATGTRSLLGSHSTKRSRRDTSPDHAFKRPRRPAPSFTTETSAPAPTVTSSTSHADVRMVDDPGSGNLLDPTGNGGATDFTGYAAELTLGPEEAQLAEMFADLDGTLTSQGLSMPGGHFTTLAQDGALAAMRLTTVPTGADGNGLFLAAGWSLIENGLAPPGRDLTDAEPGLRKRAAHYVFAHPEQFIGMVPPGHPSDPAILQAAIRRRATELVTDTDWGTTEQDWALVALARSWDLDFAYVAYDGAVHTIHGDPDGDGETAFTLVHVPHHDDPTRSVHWVATRSSAVPDQPQGNEPESFPQPIVTDATPPPVQGLSGPTARWLTGSATTPDAGVVHSALRMLRSLHTADPATVTDAVQRARVLVGEVVDDPTPLTTRTGTDLRDHLVDAGVDLTTLPGVLPPVLALTTVAAAQLAADATLTADDLADGNGTRADAAATADRTARSLVTRGARAWNLLTPELHAGRLLRARADPTSGAGPEGRAAAASHLATLLRTDPDLTDVHALVETVMRTHGLADRTALRGGHPIRHRNRPGGSSEQASRRADRPGLLTRALGRLRDQRHVETAAPPDDDPSRAEHRWARQARHPFHERWMATLDRRGARLLPRDQVVMPPRWLDPFVDDVLHRSLGTSHVTDRALRHALRAQALRLYGRHRATDPVPAVFEEETAHDRAVRALGVRQQSRSHDSRERADALAWLGSRSDEELVAAGLLLPAGFSTDRHVRNPFDGSREVFLHLVQTLSGAPENGEFPDDAHQRWSDALDRARAVLDAPRPAQWTRAETAQIVHDLQLQTVSPLQELAGARSADGVTLEEVETALAALRTVDPPALQRVAVPLIGRWWSSVSHNPAIKEAMWNWPDLFAPEVVSTLHVRAALAAEWGVSPLLVTTGQAEHAIAAAERLRNAGALSWPDVVAATPATSPADVRLPDLREFPPYVQHSVAQEVIALARAATELTVPAVDFHREGIPGGVSSRPDARIGLEVEFEFPYAPVGDAGSLDSAVMPGAEFPPDDPGAGPSTVRTHPPARTDPPDETDPPEETPSTPVLVPRARIARALAAMPPRGDQDQPGAGDGQGRWALTADGSLLNGAEAISPRLRGDRAWPDVADVLDILRANGATADQSARWGRATTGGHVNVSFDGHTENSAYFRLADIFKVYETTLFQLANHPDRIPRDLKWTAPNPVGGRSGPPPTVADVAALSFGKRSALNFANVRGDDDTDRVEARLWDGTLDPGEWQIRTEVSLAALDVAMDAQRTEQLRLAKEVPALLGWNHGDEDTALADVLGLMAGLGLSPAAQMQLLQLFATTREWSRPLPVVPETVDHRKFTKGGADTASMVFLTADRGVVVPGPGDSAADVWRTATSLPTTPRTWTAFFSANPEGTEVRLLDGNRLTLRDAVASMNASGQIRPETLVVLASPGAVGDSARTGGRTVAQRFGQIIDGDSRRKHDVLAAGGAALRVTPDGRILTGDPVDVDGARRHEPASWWFFAAEFPDGYDTEEAEAREAAAVARTALEELLHRRPGGELVTAAAAAARSWLAARDRVPRAEGFSTDADPTEVVAALDGLFREHRHNQTTRDPAGPLARNRLATALRVLEGHLGVPLREPGPATAGHRDRARGSTDLLTRVADTTRNRVSTGAVRDSPELRLALSTVGRTHRELLTVRTDDEHETATAEHSAALRRLEGRLGEPLRPGPLPARPESVEEVLQTWADSARSVVEQVRSLIDRHPSRTPVVGASGITAQETPGRGDRLVGAPGDSPRFLEAVQTLVGVQGLPLTARDAAEGTDAVREVSGAIRSLERLLKRPLRPPVALPRETVALREEAVSRAHAVRAAAVGKTTPGSAETAGPPEQLLTALDDALEDLSTAVTVDEIAEDAEWLDERAAHLLAEGPLDRYVRPTQPGWLTTPDDPTGALYRAADEASDAALYANHFHQQHSPDSWIDAYEPARALRTARATLLLSHTPEDVVRNAAHVESAVAQLTTAVGRRVTPLPPLAPGEDAVATRYLALAASTRALRWKLPALPSGRRGEPGDDAQLPGSPGDVLTGNVLTGNVLMGELREQRGRLLAVTRAEDVDLLADAVNTTVAELSTLLGRSADAPSWTADRQGLTISRWTSGLRRAEEALTRVASRPPHPDADETFVGMAAEQLAAAFDRLLLTKKAPATRTAVADVETALTTLTTLHRERLTTEPVLGSSQQVYDAAVGRARAALQTVDRWHERSPHRSADPEVDRHYAEVLTALGRLWTVEKQSRVTTALTALEERLQPFEALLERHRQG